MNFLNLFVHALNSQRLMYKVILICRIVIPMQNDNDIPFINNDYLVEIIMLIFQKLHSYGRLAILVCMNTSRQTYLQDKGNVERYK